MTDASPLAEALRDPATIVTLDREGWTALLAVARAEQLLGTLAWRLDGLAMPAGVAAVLRDAREAAEAGRRAALWEAEMARRALAPIGCRVVLLKGTAFVAAGLMAGQGRQIGDLDLLVPREAVDAVEEALLAAGWEWVKPDPYDDLYYRTWTHELPPLIHRDRDRMIDVHHTILPPTALPTPDAAALIGAAERLENGLFILSPEHLVIHAAAHLLADGDLSGGLRNLWDIDRLCREFGDHRERFYPRLLDEAGRHGLGPAAQRALRLARSVFGTPVPEGKPQRSDRLFRRRLLARDGWGRGTRPVTRWAFYVRSHWLRMPPALLARHLWIKWRRRTA